MDVSHKKVDIRLAVGTPVGEQPISIYCPDYIHKERVGRSDDKGSLTVYRDNIHCFGCQFHIGRRFAALAFLMGYWDGTGDIKSETVTRAIGKAKKHLPKLVNERKQQDEAEKETEPLSPYMAEAFQQYLFKYKGDRLVEELYQRRGLTEETVRFAGIGHTGTHFALPVLGTSGQLYTIRFRSDEEVTDGNGEGSRKYKGMWGRNSATLYPMQAVLGLTQVGELWITEGEFDALASLQAGNTTLTVTNGAGSISKIVGLVDELGLKVGRWILATDQDGAGEKAARELAAVLHESGQSSVRARWKWGKDLCEYYATGGSRERITYEKLYSEVVGREIKGALAAIA